MAWGVGGWEAVKPARLLVQEGMAAGRAAAVDGNAGIGVSGLVKLKALVMSPTVARRQAERLGTSAPKRVSRKRRIDVWSNRSEETKPPRLKGEMTIMGTRHPRPMGPLMAGFPATVGSGTAGTV